MATPLYWKSWEITNIVFTSLLRYPFHIFMLPQQKKLVFVTHKVKQVPLFVLIIILLAFFNLYTFIILKTLVFKTLSIQPHLMLLNVAICGMIFLCLLIAAILLIYDNTFVQYCNGVLDYDQQIVQQKEVTINDNGVFSIWALLKNGKYFI